MVVPASKHIQLSVLTIIVNYVMFLSTVFAKKHSFFVTDCKRPSVDILDKNYQDPEYFQNISGPQSITIITKKKVTASSSLNIDADSHATLVLFGKKITADLRKAQLVEAFGAPTDTKTFPPEFIASTDQGTSIRLQAFVKGEKVWKYRILIGTTKSEWTTIGTEK